MSDESGDDFGRVVDEKGNPISQGVFNALMKALERIQAEESKQRRVVEVLIAAGFLNREKYEEARSLVENFL